MRNDHFNRWVTLSFRSWNVIIIQCVIDALSILIQFAWNTLIIRLFSSIYIWPTWKMCLHIQMIVIFWDRDLYKRLYYLIEWLTIWSTLQCSFTFFLQKKLSQLQLSPYIYKGFVTWSISHLQLPHFQLFRWFVFNNQQILLFQCKTLMLNITRIENLEMLYS